VEISHDEVAAVADKMHCDVNCRQKVEPESFSSEIRGDAFQLKTNRLGLFAVLPERYQSIHFASKLSQLSQDRQSLSANVGAQAVEFDLV
jgi:hypothetical protein